MRAVVQRVKLTQVAVGRQTVAEIKQGLLVLVGIAATDTEVEAEKVAKKIVDLRIFADKENRFNLSLSQINGEILLLPQFTLFAEVKGQNRPYFGAAAKAAKAESLYNFLIQQLEKLKMRVKRGVFGAYMQVMLINDGPVTIILDTNEF